MFANTCRHCEREIKLVAATKYLEEFASIYHTSIYTQKKLRICEEVNTLDAEAPFYELMPDCPDYPR